MSPLHWGYKKNQAVQYSLHTWCFMLLDVSGYLMGFFSLTSSYSTS